MPSIYNFSELEILAFFLVLIRISGFIVTWPVFGVNLIPSPAKILLGLAISILIFPVIKWDGVSGQLDSLVIVWLAVRELFIGLVTGFLARMFFYVFNIFGEIVSVSMGIASAQLFNPALDSRATAMEQFQVALATLFFLAINGHHLFLSGIIDTFRLIPLDPGGLDLMALKSMGVIVQDVMIIGVQLSAPVLISILFMNLSMAVIGRAVPQINVLITSLPVNILVGFVVLIVTVPIVIWQMNDIMELTTTRLFQILRGF